MKAIRCALALLLCLGLLLGNCGALAESFSARQVAWCDEYVNLREEPDSKSRSLDRVYIGEVVMAKQRRNPHPLILSALAPCPR